VASSARQFSLAGRLTESFEEYRQDFGGRMSEAAGIIGRSVVQRDDGWQIAPSPEDQKTLRKIPDLRIAARRLADQTTLGGSDLVLASAFDVIATNSAGPEQPTAFRELISSAAGPVEVAMTRSGMQVSDILQWLAELAREALPALLLIGGGSLVVAALSIRNDLKPLRRVADEAGRIGPAATAARLDEAGMPTEILPLVRAINGALERLDAAFESQRQFTADAAHELRTPIAVLRARIEALSANGGAAAPLMADVDRLSRLVEQLLTVSVLDGKAFALDRQVDVGAVARGVVADLAPLAVNRGQSLAFEPPRRPVRIAGNALALEEGVRNLVDNALRHTPCGEAVEVAVRDNGTIEVSDRGPGVPAHHREAIFRRFWRGSAVSNEGAGLGLPIVKRIAEAHGGTVRVGDRKGGGAVFRIELPLQH
jgi:signal transduction histidine kinase